MAACVATRRGCYDMDTAVVRVGVAGWDYRDWWGVVYPLPRPRGFDSLTYLARYFDTIEINSTFYRPPAPKAAAGWAVRVASNPRFKFTAKLWQRFTHERDTPWAATDVDQVTAGQRYDYLYSAAELKSWLDRIHEVAKRTRETYVITNNHYRGQAATNAAMLRKLGGEDVVLVPPELLDAYGAVLAPLGIGAES